MKRIYLEEILPKIRKTDIRAAIQWCHRNNVAICKDGRDKYAVYDDFVKAYNRPSIEGLNEKGLNNIQFMDDSFNKTESFSISKRRYRPSSNASKKFNNLLNNL